MIYPSGRAVWAGAAGAIPAFLVALLLPAHWYLGLLWICLLLAFLAVDAVAGAGPATLTAGVQSSPQVGVGGRLTVHVTARFDGAAPRNLEVRLAHDARLDPLDGPGGPIGPAGMLDVDFRAVRRGMAALDRLWVRWRGPFGLMWKQAELPVAHAVAVVPDVSSARETAITYLQRDALVGDHARRQVGQGREFDSLKDY